MIVEPKPKERNNMKTKIEIKSIWGSVLFEYEKENNSVKETLIEAVKRGADLRGANLRGAYLGGADLRGAYLGEWGNINEPSDILIIGAIGSRNGYTTIFHTDKGVFVRCGCFKGSLEEFENRVKETHHGNKHERDYLALIQFAKIKFEL